MLIKKPQLEKQKIPKLRFVNFTNEWKEERLGDVVTYTKGFAFKSSTYQDKGIRIVRASDLGRTNIKTDNDKIFIDKKIAENFEKYKLKVNNIVITTVGSRPEMLDSAVGRGVFIDNDDEGLLNQNMLKIESGDLINNRFLFSYINTPYYVKHIKEIKRGNANQANITVKDLLNYRIYTTSIEEQHKIGGFLGVVDKWIEGLKDQKENFELYKKGMVQKIFSQQTIFKDEGGNKFPEWEEKKLGDFLFLKSNRNKSNEVDLILSVSNKKGFITQAEQFENHRVASKDIGGYKIVEKFDFAYNPSRINVGSIACLKNFEKGVVSPMYIVFKLLDTLNITFFENFIQTLSFNNMVKAGCSGSVRDSLNFEDLEKFKVKFPKINEQQKIANFVDSIDKVIELKQQQISQAEEWKKGLMQQLFV